MYGKINYANVLEKEFLSFLKGLEQSAKSALKLLALFGKALKFALGGVARAAFIPPKLIKRLSPQSFEELEGAQRESHYGFYRGPPNGPLF